MALVRNDQRGRNGWQHNTTISRDILSDCRRNFGRARVLRHLHDLSLPTLARRKREKERKLGHKSKCR
jgi:hypothetical protein